MGMWLDQDVLNRLLALQPTRSCSAVYSARLVLLQTCLAGVGQCSSTSTPIRRTVLNRFSASSARCPRTTSAKAKIKYNRGTEIFGEAEPAEYIYQVIDGSLRSYKLLSDGRRQINAFHLSGDIFELGNFNDDHRFTAERS